MQSVIKEATRVISSYQTPTASSCKQHHTGVLSAVFSLLANATLSTECRGLLRKVVSYLLWSVYVTHLVYCSLVSLTCSPHWGRGQSVLFQDVQFCSLVGYSYWWTSQDMEMVSRWSSNNQVLLWSIIIQLLWKTWLTGIAPVTAKVGRICRNHLCCFNMLWECCRLCIHPYLSYRLCKDSNRLPQTVWLCY